MAYHSYNPFTCKEEANFEFISDIGLEKKLKLSEKRFPEWSQTPLSKRSEILNRAADILEKDSGRHAKIITREMGKPISQSLAEVKKCAWVSRYYAKNAGSFLEPGKLESTAEESYVRYDPLGIIFAIMPWNFPYWQTFRFLAPNLVSGNTELLKHASNVPQCALAMEELFLKAGAPEGVFQNLFISYEQVARVIGYDGVRGVTLTGSNYAGNRIAEIAGTHGKKTVLELGGSDPYIVFADADLEKAADCAIMARFQNNGQSCIAAKRFIVEEQAFEPFMALFKSRVESMKVGDPMDPETMIGPLARKDLLLELEDHIQHIIKQGGRILSGGKRLKEGCLILEPTIVTGLPIDSPINDIELFGPVIPVFSFKSDEEALKMANHSRFGLGASIWTGNRDRADRFAKCIETGTVAVNGMVKSEPGLPFGGIKASGYGRELSEIGMKEFLNIKTVNYF
ncbi:NAD-dependent succinate-semialdehyde dehydrogenase [Bacteroidota bacterium]